MAAGLFALAKSESASYGRGSAGGIAGCSPDAAQHVSGALQSRGLRRGWVPAQRSSVSRCIASGTHTIPYAPTNASIVPLPSAGGTTKPSALLTPTAPSAFSAAATSATITKSRAAALGQAGQRYAGIALAELIFRQEHEVRAVSA